MNFKELDPPVIEIPKQQKWYRIQLQKIRKDSVKNNGFILPPVGNLDGRFNLACHAVAYLADSPETALYESRFRREARVCTMESLRERSLVVFETVQRLRLVDLRGHEESFPVLHSLRYEHTRNLAEDCFKQQMQGIIYASAQHPYHDCLCLFENGFPAMRKIATTSLVKPQSNRLLKPVIDAAYGSRMPIIE